MREDPEALGMLRTQCVGHIAVKGHLGALASGIIWRGFLAVLEIPTANPLQFLTDCGSHRGRRALLRCFEARSDVADFIDPSKRMHFLLRQVLLQSGTIPSGVQGIGRYASASKALGQTDCKQGIR